MKKKEKKKKNNYRRVIIFFIIIIAIILILSGYFTLKVKNIYVNGNSILTEQEIIDLAGLTDYPNLYKVSKNKITKDLLKNPYINQVEITKTITGKIYLKIYENRVLFWDEKNAGYVLSNGKVAIDSRKLSGIPTLNNVVESIYYNRFLSKLIDIEIDVYNKISEIKYDPNNLDKERFLFYMTDQNYVYLTLSKFDNINNYDKIILNLDGKKGTLYLDSGNHFIVR